MKTNKILFGLSLVASMFAVTACANTSDNDLVKFTGSTTISDVTYNVVLSLNKDNTLLMEIADNVEDVTGTYEFIEGEGYEFIIGNVEYVTEWDAATTSHTFDYNLRLGDLGSGTVTLSYVDTNFVYTAKPAKVEFAENARFDGVLNAMGQHAMHLRFSADGTYAITTDTAMDMVKQLVETTGTYTFENNTFTLTIGGTEYKTVYNLHTGAYSLTYAIAGPDGSFPLTLTYQPEIIFTGTSSDFGGLVFDLHTYSDGTCLADITTTMESMNAMFDRSGTWKMVDGNYVFTIETTPGTPVDFTSSVNPETGRMEVNYEITGDRLVKSTLSCAAVDLQGFEDALSGINFDLVFTSTTEAFVDVTTTMPSMNAMFDKAGTYTFVNNVITLIVGDKTYTSTFEEETGTYSLTYELKGTEATMYPVLTTSLWA